MREASIFKRVLISNLKVVMVPIVIVMILVGYFTSDSLRRSVINEAETEVSKYVESINTEIKKVISISENTARYPLIFGGINKKYEDFYSAIIYADEVKIFLDNLTYEMAENTILICYNNDTLFDGKYFVSPESVPRYSEILNKFEETGRNIIWEENLFVDQSGQEYFQFYENMPINQGSFIIGRVYVPQAQGEISVVGKNGTIQAGGRMIRQSINKHFDAVGSVDYAKISSNYIRIYSVLVFLFVMLMAVLFYTTQKTTDKVTRDINDFIGHLDVDNIATGAIDLEVKSGEATELSVIKETISGLLSQINKITNTQHATELEKQSLEFELLQSQIDPHTLYNSLSAIRLGAFKRHDDEMVDFVDTMVSYYRKVLNKGKTVSTISDEIDLVTKYVKINELSHYKKYNLKIDVPDNVLNAVILHLLLQPFVENAIIHGLCGGKKDCEIKIKCRDDNGILNISVTDNGRGIDAEKLEKLNNIEKYEVGYGIRNAYMRLKLFYGEEGHVQFFSKQGEGTQVVIRYPM